MLLKYLTTVTFLLSLERVSSQEQASNLRMVRSGKLTESMEDIMSMAGTERDLQAADMCPAPPSRGPTDPLNVNTFIVPCGRHADCLPAAGIRPAFELCCYANLCVCGAPPTERTPPNIRCARFTCTSNAQCGPGRCLNGQCRFEEDDLRPGCTTDASCGGGNNICVNGVCRLRNNNVTGLGNLPSTTGNAVPSSTGSSGGNAQGQSIPSNGARPSSSGKMGMSKKGKKRA